MIRSNRCRDLPKSIRCAEGDNSLPAKEAHATIQKLTATNATLVETNAKLIATNQHLTKKLAKPRRKGSRKKGGSATGEEEVQVQSVQGLASDTSSSILQGVGSEQTSSSNWVEVKIWLKAAKVRWGV